MTTPLPDDALVERLAQTLVLGVVLDALRERFGHYELLGHGCSVPPAVCSSSRRTATAA